MLRWCVAVCALLYSTAAVADATKGVVVYDKGCRSRLIIETRMGYILAEWYGGSTPYNGDIVVGELNAFGMKDFYLYNRDESTRLWIDDFMLSRDRVIEKLASKCS